jgi:transposase-like protein
MGSPYIRPFVNAIESLNAKLRRSVCNRGHFPSDEAAMKLICAIARDHLKVEDASTQVGRSQSPSSR